MLYNAFTPYKLLQNMASHPDLHCLLKQTRLLGTEYDIKKKV